MIWASEWYYQSSSFHKGNHWYMFQLRYQRDDVRSPLYAYYIRKSCTLEASILFWIFSIRIFSWEPPAFTHTLYLFHVIMLVFLAIYPSKESQKLWNGYHIFVKCLMIVFLRNLKEVKSFNSYKSTLSKQKHSTCLPEKKLTVAMF